MAHDARQPGPALIHARRLLQSGGLLVLRVPNLRFYLERRNDKDSLVWNNLLGFPYLYGYTAESLNHLVKQFGFEPVRGYNSELVTMPFPDPSTRVTREQIANSRRVAEWSSQTTATSGSLTGPWIELIYRRMPEAQRNEPKISLDFLERAA